MKHRDTEYYKGLIDKEKNHLDLSYTKISDLSPLSGLTNLQSIGLSGTNVSDLSPLSGLTGLQSIDLAGTSGIDLSPLSGLTSLQSIELAGTSGIDLSPLSGLTSLQSIGLSGTNVSDLSLLSGLTSLQSIDLSGTNVSDLSLLSGLTSLQSIDLAETSGIDLSPLSGLTSLQSIDLTGTSVGDLSPLSGLSSLQSIDLTGTSVGDLSPLSGLTSLQSIDLAGTSVGDLSPLSGLTSLQSIHLGWTKVSDLSPLSGLTNLQTIYLIQTNVSDLSPLSGLTRLQSIHLAGTKVSDLSPLSGLTNLQSIGLSSTTVSDLSPLSGLTTLQSIHLAGTKVSDLSPLSGLTSLQSIDLAGTKVSDLSPLSGLTTLQSIHLSETNVSDLSPLSGLTTLQSIHLAGTKVSDLSPLSGLTNLQLIDLSRTKVSDLSPIKTHIIAGVPLRLGRRMIDDFIINVKDCPLDTVLIAAIKKGPKVALKFFQRTTKPLFEARVLLLGEPRAGKTTLRRKLKNVRAEMPTVLESTKAFEVEVEPNKCSIEFEGKKQPLTYHVWDFGGQDYYRLLHQLFISEQSVYVIVTDTDRSKNEEELDFWLETIQRLGRDNQGKYGPVILLQNPKTNREGSDFIDLKKRYPFWQQQEMYLINLNEINPDKETFSKGQASSFTKFKSHLESSFCHLSLVGKLMPSEWIPVRKQLIKWEKENWITTERFFEICSENGITTLSEQEELLDIFHTLGYILYYRNTELSGMVILRKEWVTDALYRVLDDPIVSKNKGWFNLGDASKIWKEPHYKNRTTELLSLMRVFNLSYLNEHTDRYIVPAKLQEDDSDLPLWDDSNNVSLHLKYDWMPRAIPTQLIVSLHEYIVELENGDNWIWRRGAVFNGKLLQLNDVQVRIFDNWRENKIEINARGNQSESLIRLVLKAWRKVNEPFQGKVKVDTQILCNCSECSLSTPQVFEYENVLNAAEKKKSLQCNRSLENFSASDILRGLFDSTTATLDYYDKKGLPLDEEIRNMLVNDEILNVLNLLPGSIFTDSLKRQLAEAESGYFKNLITFDEFSKVKSKIMAAILNYRNAPIDSSEKSGMSFSDWALMDTKFERHLGMSFKPVFEININNQIHNTSPSKSDSDFTEMKQQLEQLPNEILAKLKEFFEMLPEPETPQDKETYAKQVLKWLDKNAEGITVNASSSLYYDVVKSFFGFG